MVTYCIETAVLEATRPIGAKAVAVANKANKAASLNIIIIFDKSILIVRTNDLFFLQILGHQALESCLLSGFFFGGPPFFFDFELFLFFRLTIKDTSSFLALFFS